MQRSKIAQSKHHDVHLKTSAKPVQVCVHGRVCYTRREARKAEVKKLEVKSYATPEDNCLEEY